MILSLLPIPFMDRSEALELLRSYIKNDKLIKHCIATSAIMKELAKELGEDEKRWELLGLLHDIDYELVEGDMNRHGIVGSEILRKYFDESFCETVKHHNYFLFQPKSREEIALVASDNISGLIIACALVKGRKITAVTPKTVREKFKEKSFARGCNREMIAKVEELGINLDRFFEIAIKALEGVKNELDLE
jgi:putative nucleotidyltransferase with HDIG domain